MYSLLIQNGHLIDRKSGLDKIGDIAIENDRIAAVGTLLSSKAQCTIDAKGAIVSPGLIDFHAHLYPLCPSGIPAEAVCFSTGVTTAVDAGSAGAANYPFFHPFIHMSKLRIRAFLHVSSHGLANHPAIESVDPVYFDPIQIKDVLCTYSNKLLGLKIRTSKNIVREFGWKPLQYTVDIAQQCGVPVMVHCTDPPGPMEDLLSFLRPGDIVTHVYHNTGHTILDSSGHVTDAVWKARERGILFDAANARYHFGFSTAISALADGFPPDTISSDLTAFGMFQPPTVFSMPMLASKYLALGMDLPDILARMTSIPAALLGIDQEVGTLQPGKKADLAIFYLQSRDTIFGDRPYTDPDIHYVTGHSVLTPALTIKDGQIVFRIHII